MLGLLLGLAAAEIVFVTEVSRHGSRSPTKFYSWDKDGRWPQGEGEITPLGMRQHYLIGYELRNRYIIQNQVLSANYSADEVYFRSTDVNRTLMSAYSQLQGLYPDGTGPSLHDISLQSTAVPPIKVSNLTAIQAELGIAALPDFMQAKPVHSTTKMTDYLLRIQDNCKLVDELIETSNQEEYAALCKKYSSTIQVIADYFKVSFDEACSMSDNVQGSVVANNFCGYSLPSQFSDPTFIANIKAYHAETFSLQYGSPAIVPEAIVTPYMNLLVQTFSAVAAGPQDLKFIFLSAHDSTLQAFVNGMQLSNRSFPVYASTLITELHLINGSYFVRMLYNDEEVTVPDCQQTVCPLDTFLGYLNRRIVPNLEQLCEADASDYRSSQGSSGAIVVLALFSGGGLSLLLYLVSCNRKKRRGLLETVSV
mmetsp:Transcript_1180/g.2854  ORF Transcript_1180/g.2854 Transcript_1180/m.2854 type:complete len:423 (-) Transcript_1180:3844-5112(-)